MSKICGIYCIENLVNHKKYIGQSVDVASRLSGHKTKLRNNTHKNEHLQAAFNKYGIDSFAFYVVKECDESELDAFEIYYIAEMNTTDFRYGYNIEDGGNKNKHLSAETKKKLSDIHTGLTMSDEVKKKMSESRRGENNPMFGKHHDDETKKLISDRNKGKTGHTISEEQKEICRQVNTGKVVSDETREKLSKAMAGKTPSNKNMTKVQCVETGVVYDSPSDAAKEYNIRSGNILECCRGIRKTCGGVHWKYLDN